MRKLPAPSGLSPSPPCSFLRAARPRALSCGVLKIRAQRSSPGSLENAPHVGDEDSPLPCRVWEARSDLGSKMGDFGGTVTCCEMPSLGKQPAAPHGSPPRCRFPTCLQIPSQHGHLFGTEKGKMRAALTTGTARYLIAGDAADIYCQRGVFRSCFLCGCCLYVC